MTKLSLKAAIEERPVILDGALATELEKRGVATDNALWSATALIDQADEISAVHQSYFKVGAQVATTDTYQANPQAFEAAGMSASQAAALITKAVKVANDSRDKSQSQTKLTLYTAGSIGPYGAYLADGSEYRGDYQLPVADFQKFHAERLKLVIAAGVDVLVLETMPNFAEVQALVTYLAEHFPEQPFWVSFSLKNAEQLCDGTDLRVAAEWVSQFPQAIAVGANCTDLVTITNAVKYLYPASKLPLVVYPNAGDLYDPKTKKWQRTKHSHQFSEFVPTWLANGVRLLGGCCRTTPQDIQTICQLVD